MATPPIAGGGQPPSRLFGGIFGRVRLLILIVLLSLLALCLVFAWITRGAVSTLAFLRQSHHAAAGQTIVDLGPWQTAETLASLAVTAEENEYAREAEHLADHAVDQAFAFALRQADLQTRRKAYTGEALTFSQRVAQLQEAIALDRAAVDQIKSQGGSKNDFGADVLQVAQAQLDLDTDELADAQSDLARASGDQSVRIQQELTAHQAAMHDYDTRVKNGAPVASVSVKSHGALGGRLQAWFDQRSRYASIQQAQAAAQNDVRSITAEHNAIEGKLNTKPAAGSDPLALTQLQSRRIQRQILSIDDDRIQTEQQLADVYGKWGSQVQLQHQLLLHLILRSFALILGIVIAMILGDTLVRRFFDNPNLDYRQSQILRTIIEVSVQVIGVLLIALVLFGPPRQTATAIGLVSAALTISLQDYILAFFGWFILVGRNGVRVADMIEINGVCGEVIDIGLMSTTLLETTSLASQNQLTGRRVSFLNSFAIRGQFFNFSSKGQWLWDEINVSIPAGRDFYTLASSIERLVHDDTADNARSAEQEWNANVRGSGLGRLSAAPVFMLRPSASGVEIQVRYVSSATNRFTVRDRLYRKIIELLEQKQEPGAAATPAVITT